MIRCSINDLFLSGAIVVRFVSIDAFLCGYFKLNDATINRRQINVKIIANIEVGLFDTLMISFAIG